MPELPELEGLVRWLDALLRGREITEVRLRSVAALKTYDPPVSSLRGVTVERVTRRGKYVVIGTESLRLVTHLSRGGWLRWTVEPTSRALSLRGPMVAEVRFPSASLDITEHGKEKRLAIWLVRELHEIPQIAELGREALDPTLGQEEFARLVRSRPGTLKAALSDQHVLAGIGNAYSDEILHAARLSPFTRTSGLGDSDLEQLFEAMGETLREAMSRATSLDGKGLKDDKRVHFRVHARTGQPCPVCKDTVREVWTANRSFQYCPTCQTGGRVCKDRRLSRLLK